jgi:hypothetical protein
LLITIVVLVVFGGDENQTQNCRKTSFEKAIFF